MRYELADYECVVDGRCESMMGPRQVSQAALFNPADAESQLKM